MRYCNRGHACTEHPLRLEYVTDSEKYRIIAASKKDEILSQLPALGISKEVLFADNVDMVFAAVKEHQESRYS